MKFLANLFGSKSADAKTLEEFRAQVAAAKQSAEAVAALFTTATLDLDALLAAGPDSLKAHLAGLSAKDGELAAAQAEITRLKGAIDAVGIQLSAATGEASALTAKFSALITAIAPLGITASTKPEEFAALIDSHVKQAAALELAKTGHKPVADVPPPVPGKPAATAEVTPLFGLAKVEAAFRAESAKTARR